MYIQEAARLMEMSSISHHIINYAVRTVKLSCIV